MDASTTELLDQWVMASKGRHYLIQRQPYERKAWCELRFADGRVRRFPGDSPERAREGAIECIRKEEAER